MLVFAPMSSHMVVELLGQCIECIANRHIYVRVFLSVVARAINEKLSARNREIDVDREGAAFIAVRGRRIDYHMTAYDVFEMTLDLRQVFADAFFHRRGGSHMTECDL